MVTFRSGSWKGDYVVKSIGNTFELRVPREEVNSVVKELLENDVIDLTVEEPNLEEVLRYVVKAG